MSATKSSRFIRSSPGTWLIGNQIERFSPARLPSKGDVLKLFNFYHLGEKRTERISIRETANAVIEIWERARLPTQRIDSIERIIRKLLVQYNILKKSRKNNLKSSRAKEVTFKADLNKIFDAATKDAFNKIKNEEDKLFLIMQRENNTSCRERRSQAKERNGIRGKTVA